MLGEYTSFDDIPNDTYDILYSDPPWLYYGDPNKMAAAGKHYDLMSREALEGLPVLSKCRKEAIHFMWTTCPLLDVGIDLMRSWGFHYRGVAFVWVKTRSDGTAIGAQGVRPSIVKPLVEIVIAGSTVPKGRPLPLLDESVRQTVFGGEDEFITDPVFAARGQHSAKPPEVRTRIERLFGRVRYLELFARGAPVPGWDRFGNELGVAEPSVLDLMGGT